MFSVVNTVKGIVPLISVSVQLSFVYRKLVDFCVLIFYPDNFLKEISGVEFT